MKRGIATFTLDYGKCPPWLFERMVKLGREIIQVMVAEYGPHEFVRRMGDPVWFQSLGTVLAFDWNASGLTTVLTGALKEAIKGQEKDFGIFICGGKGITSRKTPDQIEYWGEQLNTSPDTLKQLDYSSRMSAKVDSALVQDGYDLYHHVFFFSYEKNDHGIRRDSPSGRLSNSKPQITWTVVQQGMNQNSKTARRYHWHDEMLTPAEFINEPHSGIASQVFNKQTLNLTASKSKQNREVSSKLIQQGYKYIHKDLELLRKHSSSTSRMISYRVKNKMNSVIPTEAKQSGGVSYNPNSIVGDSSTSLGMTNGQTDIYTFLELSRNDFYHHPVETEDFSKSSYLKKILHKVTESAPQSYEKILAIEGVGAKTMRALSLVAEIIYGAKPSYEDPARYSFAHGGKDEIPYPVDRRTYDETIEMLAKVVKKSKISLFEKEKIYKRLDK